MGGVRVKFWLGPGTLLEPNSARLDINDGRVKLMPL